MADWKNTDFKTVLKEAQAIQKKAKEAAAL
jgi:hypothetical protein